MTGDEESGLPGAEDVFGFGSDESEPAEGEKPAEAEKAEEIGTSGFDLPTIERGGELEAEMDALPTEADASFALDGLETFDELAVEDPSDPQMPGVDGLVVDGDYGAADDFERAVQELTIIEGDALPPVEEDIDLTIDDGPLVTETVKTAPEVRHRALEVLERRRKRRALRGRLMGVVLTAAVLGGAGYVVAYMGIVEVPGITPEARYQTDVGAPVALPGPQPDTPVMGHVIFIDAWREAEMPQAWADALRERMPNLLGLVTPVMIEGEQQHALMVGPAYSTAEANRLRGPLAVAFDLLNPDPDSWTVQERPYSFFFGEYEVLADANDHTQALAGMSIPAFALRVGYSDGKRAFRVYGGAFVDASEAGGMGRILDDNGLDDVPLTERRGRLPR